MTESDSAQRSGTAKAGGRSLGGKILVIGSLALNAFLIAMIAGMFFGSNDQQRPRRGIPEMVSIRVALQDAPKELREEARALRQDVRELFLPVMREIDQARFDLAAAARAEPFDLSSVDIALADLRAAQAARWILLDRGIRELLEKADPETRERFAATLEQEVAKRQKRRAERAARRAYERAN